MQVPPKYSAKNVNGRRGYELARAGVEFELQAKKVHIYGMELLERSRENTFRIKINCGGGTYIRSLARDIAAALGTNAVMSSLLRTKSGVFTLEHAIDFSLLEKDPSLEELERYLIPTESVLPFERLPLKEGDMRIFNGLAIACDQADGLYKLYKEEKFYGLAEVKDKKAKAKTKLC